MILSRLRSRRGGGSGRLLRTLAVAKGSRDVVGFADEAPFDDAVPVSGLQPAAARGTGETRHVVDGGATWRLHDELVGRNLAMTRAALAAHTEKTATKTWESVRELISCRERMNLEYLYYQKKLRFFI